uniref:SFRICE_037853 n=1 Tax=Spodoptera frugiperda TaxID=7108 RepID=A0A2H1WAC0_SPOFR
MYRAKADNPPSRENDIASLLVHMTAQLARWLGNWLPCNVSRVQFPHGPTFCVRSTDCCSGSGCRVYVNFERCVFGVEWFQVLSIVDEGDSYLITI